MTPPLLAFRSRWSRASPRGHERSPAARLRLLAASRDDCTEAILLAHEFLLDLMVELVRAGLATATTECVVAPGYAANGRR
jgi:hypothetical protein